MNFQRRRTRKQSRPRLASPTGWGCPKHSMSPPPITDPEPQRRGTNHKQYVRPRLFVIEARYTREPRWQHQRSKWGCWREWSRHRTEAGRERALVRHRRNCINDLMHSKWRTPMAFRISQSSARP